LDDYGLIVPRKAQGILTATIANQIFPVAIVDSEELFQSVNPAHSKYKIGGMTAAEVFDERLIIVDGNWGNNSLAADLVLQGLFFSNRYNRNDKSVNLTGIPDKAAEATSHFLRQDLFEQYRGRYLNWLEQGI